MTGPLGVGVIGAGLADGLDMAAAIDFLSKEKVPS